MSSTSESKIQTIQQFQRTPGDTGSSGVQVALLTQRIGYLTEHFKHHNQDAHSRRGLLKLVNQRRKLLDYLKRKNQSGYQQLITTLDLRR